MYNSEDNENEDRKLAAELAEKVSRFVNTMGNADRVKFFVEAMHGEHRTLQQSFTGLALAWLKHLASLNEGQYDLRNKASVEVAKKLVGKLDKYDLHLPTV
jgi:hypothetical protein